MTTLDVLDDRFFREIFIDNVYPVFPEARTVFDIGSLGLEYSIKVYPYAEGIVALEPHPEHAAKIKKAIETHKLTKIRFLEMALAKESGLRKFGNLGSYGGSALRDNGEVEVQAISLRDLMERMAITELDMLKMDIEGGEKEIITDDFPYGLVKNIAFEVHGGNENLIKRLADNNYEITTNKYSVCIARFK